MGSEEIDGFHTRRLRATDPNKAVDAGEQRMGVEGTASRFEIWVDDDDLLRRIQFTIEDAFDTPGERWTVTIRLYDLGEPIVIEAPANAPEWTPPVDPAPE